MAEAHGATAYRAPLVGYASAADIPFTTPPAKERCLWFYDGGCWECITHCPVKALSMDGAIDKHLCNHRLSGLA